MNQNVTAKPKASRKLLLIAGGGLVALCVICGIVYAVSPKTAPVSTLDAAAIYTQAAGTAFAQMSNSAGSQPTEPPAPEATATTAPAPKPAGGDTRDNPVSGTAGVDIGGGMVLTVMGASRPADSMVASGNMFNATPAADTEYAAVQIQVECHKSANEKCTFMPTELKSVGADGQIRDLQWVSGVPNAMSEMSYEFFGGSKVGGVLVFLVPKGDDKAVLFHEPLLFGSPVYFTMQ
jgi:hypothetical protein